MKKFTLFAMTLLMVLGLNAQQIVPEKARNAEPKSRAIGLMPETPVTKKTYSNVRWVSSDAYMKYLVPSSYNINSKRTHLTLFPDSAVNNIVHKDGEEKISVNSTWMHAIGNSFDPYSESYDKMFMGGIFPTPSYPATETYGYNIDTVRVYGTYYWGNKKGYDGTAPDTMRIFLSYHEVYKQIGNKVEWTNLHWTSDKNQDTALFAPMVKVDTNTFRNSIGSALTPAAKNCVTIDYVLTAADSNRYWDSINSQNDTVTYYTFKNWTVPTTLNGATEKGFIVPPGAVISCLVKFIPGYTYNLGDTLTYGEATVDNYYKQGYPKYCYNTFGVMTYAESSSNSKAFCDPYGYNFNFYEHLQTRYQMWMTNDTTPNTLYNSMYYPNGHYLPVYEYHLSIDSSITEEVCDSLLWRHEHDTTGIFEANDIIENIYPNPANDFVTVTLKSSDRALIRVYNVMGQAVRYITTNEERNIISTKDLAAGIYVISVEQNGKRFNTKLYIR